MEEYIELKNNIMTPLHWASWYGANNILAFVIKRLNKKGEGNVIKQMNKKNNKGLTPVMLAVIASKTATLKLLLEIGGIKLTEGDKTLKTIIDHAKKMEYHEAVILLE